MVPETGVTRGKVPSYRHAILGSYEPAVTVEGVTPALRGGSAPARGCPVGPHPEGVLSHGSSVSAMCPKSHGDGARAVPKASARGLPKGPEEGLEPCDEGGKSKLVHARVCRPLPACPETDPIWDRTRSWSWSARYLITRCTGMATPPSTTMWCVSPTPEPIGGGKALGGVETPGLGAGKRSRRRGNPPNEDRISAGSAGTERVSTEETTETWWREDP